MTSNPSEDTEKFDIYECTLSVVRGEKNCMFGIQVVGSFKDAYAPVIKCKEVE